MDKHLKDLGAQTILAIGEGDEQNGQEESFKEWTKNVFKVSQQKARNLNQKPTRAQKGIK